MDSSRVSRTFAHALKRYPQVDASSSSNSSAAPSATATAPAPLTAATATGVSPGAIKAIVAVIVVFVAVVAGYSLFKFFQWRRDRRVAPSTVVAQTLNAEKAGRGNAPSYLDLENGVLRTQQPNKAVILPLAPPSPDTNVGWVPQIKPWMPQAQSPLKSSYGLSEKEQEVMAYTEPEEVQTPPPVYNNNRPPAFPVSSVTPSLPVNLTVDVPAASADAPTSPLSPRTASMPDGPASNQQSKRVSVANFGLGGKDKGKGKQGSRLMTVDTEFHPSMDDELSIRVGETLRLLDEYEDGWCLVERGSGNTIESGVIPRLCLIEQLPTHVHQAPPYSSFASASADDRIGRF